MHLSTGHEVVTPEVDTKGLVVPKAITEITNVTRLRLEKYPTYFFTLANFGKIAAEVSLTMSTNMVDYSCIARLTIQAGEVVSIPVPRGSAESVSILTTQKISLMELTYEVESSMLEPNNKGLEVFHDGCIAGLRNTGQRFYTMARDNACVSIKKVGGAAKYKLELESNRILKIVRGRITYNTIGKVIFLTSDEFTQDMYISNTEHCLINIVTAIQRPSAATVAGKKVWRIG